MQGSSIHSLSQLLVERTSEPEIRFQQMYNIVHIDEKWFYLTKTTDMYCLLPFELEPCRICKSKRFIPKVMLMCVVGRLQKGHNGEADFDGMFGIFPFTIEEKAVHNQGRNQKMSYSTSYVLSFFIWKLFAIRF